MFLRARRPLGAAVLLAELIRSGSGAAEVWCGLGAALLGAREPLEVRPFERWAAWVLRDAEPVVLGTPFAQPRLDLARDLPPPATEEPLRAYELDELVGFLHDGGREPLVRAVDGLVGDDRVAAVATLAETSGHAAPVVVAAIRGRWGLAAARAALRRAPRWVEVAAVRAAITAATHGPDRDRLEPHLGHAVDALDGRA